jgi:hypothetical protein
MRQLAEEEFQKIKQSQHHQAYGMGDSINVNAINDALLLSEQENRLLKEEIFRLQKEIQQSEQLKQQLHETDALQQQTQLKYKQLLKNFDEVRRRAETAETSQSNLQGSDNDYSIIEEHLLQESEQLQVELNQTQQKLKATLSAYKKAEAELSHLKERIKRQEYEFEIQLGDEQMQRSIAEKKLAEFVKKSAGAKPKGDPLTFSATPTISKTEEPSKTELKPIVDNSSVLFGASSGTAASKPGKTTTIGRRANKPPTMRSWASTILISTIFGLLAIGGYMLWQDSKSAATSTTQVLKQPNSTNESSAGTPNTQNTVNNISPESSPIAHPFTPDKNKRSMEDAKTVLQAEHTLRQQAEEELRRFSQTK